MEEYKTIQIPFDERHSKLYKWLTGKINRAKPQKQADTIRKLLEELMELQKGQTR